MSTIDRLRELEAAATPGPWQWLDSGGDPDEDDELQDGRGEMVASGFRDDILPEITDGRLCAEARNHLSALLDVAEAARALLDPSAPGRHTERREALRAALERLEAA